MGDATQICAGIPSALSAGVFVAHQDPATLALILVAALAFDRFFGEPLGCVHPVVWMGRLITFVRGRAPTSRWGALVFGAAMALGVPGLFAWLAWGSSSLPIIGPVLAVFWTTSSFAMRSLGQARLKVSAPLARGDLAGAREGLSWLCSRDPRQLSGSELSAATIESLAENASDSVVAPLFFFALFGVPGIVAYRAVNTLDAMVGYRGELEYLGKASARLDDLLNLLPARITAGLLLLVSPKRGQGFRVMLRDASKTESPNAGWPMAAMAGLLGVQLEKVDHYTLGAPGTTPEAAHIELCWRWVHRACWVWAACSVGALAGVWALQG